MKGGDNFIINPTYKERQAEEQELDLVVCGKEGTINMIEVGSKETKEEVIMAGLSKALEALEKIEKFQRDIIAEIGKRKTPVEFKDFSPEILAIFNSEIEPKMQNLLGAPGKEKIHDLEDEWFIIAAEKLPEVSKAELERVFHEAINNFVHALSIEENKRIDGRGFDEIRPLYAKAGGVSPILHGSGIFYRGGTHVMSVLTLGAPGDSLVIDGMETQMDKRFMHHYNFPPFAPGEVGQLAMAPWLKRLYCRSFPQKNLSLTLYV
jgi:polyribonucleotide nucleotidyltransferase